MANKVRRSEEQWAAIISDVERAVARGQKPGPYLRSRGIPYGSYYGQLYRVKNSKGAKGKKGGFVSFVPTTGATITVTTKDGITISVPPSAEALRTALEVVRQG